MSKFHANIFPTTYRPQKFSKIRGLKVYFFHLPTVKKYPKLKTIFRKIFLQKWALNCVV